jgi:hypothetical protein
VQDKRNSIRDARHRGSHSKVAPVRRTLIVLGALALVLATLASCRTTPYVRQLPAWVRQVYVPMMLNQSTEPELEEHITNAFTTELLADGRVDVVSKDACDAVVQVALKDYKETAVGFSTDDVESSTQVDLTFAMQLFDKSDLKTPIGTTDDFTVTFRWYSEYRANDSLLEVDARERMAASAGRELVHRLLTEVDVTKE